MLCKVPDLTYDVVLDKERYSNGSRIVHIATKEHRDDKKLSMTVQILGDESKYKLIDAAAAYEKLKAIGQSIEKDLIEEVKKLKQKDDKIDLGKSIKEGLNILNLQLSYINHNIDSFVNEFANITFKKTDIDQILDISDIDILDFISFCYFIYEADLLIKTLNSKQPKKIPYLFKSQYPDFKELKLREQRILSELDEYRKIDVLTTIFDKEYHVIEVSNNALVPVLYHLKALVRNYKETTKSYIVTCEFCGWIFRTSTAHQRCCSSKICQREKNRRNRYKLRHSAD